MSETIPQPVEDIKPANDVLTGLSIGAMLTALQIGFHESVHAVTCRALGDQLLELSALHVDCISQSTINGKLVALSAPLANILVGLFLLWLLRTRQGMGSTTRYMVWLFMLFHLLAGTGYLMFSGIGNFGDIAVVIEGWQPHWFWRISSALLGTATYLGTVYIALIEMGRFIGGSDINDQVGRLSWLLILAYIGSLLTGLAAGAMNPGGILGIASLAGVFGIASGASPLLWAPQWFRAKMFVKDADQDQLILSRSWSIVGISLVIVALYALVMGPSIQF